VNQLVSALFHVDSGKAPLLYRDAGSEALVHKFEQAVSQRPNSEMLHEGNDYKFCYLFNFNLQQDILVKHCHTLTRFPDDILL
jgi:hypothetical protein